MSANAPRISGDVSMKAVSDDHMDATFSSEEAYALIKEKNRVNFLETVAEGLDQRVQFVKMQKYSPWHDIEPLTAKKNFINCVVEIQAGEKIKYEVATKEDFNSIAPDVKDGKVRTLEYTGDGDADNLYKFSGMPHAYGMIPKTFEDPSHKETVPVAVVGETAEEMTEVGGDEDPIDIYVLSDKKLPMGLVQCKVIGVIHFVDSGEIDYKIIAVDAGYKDIDSINELSDLKNTSDFAKAEDEINNWLKYYKSVDNAGKTLENPEKKYGKYIVNRPTDSKEAMRVIEECKGYYERIVASEDVQKEDDYKKLKWTTPSLE